MPESIQHKLDRVRPPRVQITYDVEIGDAIEKKELPFVVGIMADLSGMPERDLSPGRPDPASFNGKTRPAKQGVAQPKPLKERKYIEIDRDNFNSVMESIAPRLVLSVARAEKNPPREYTHDEELAYRKEKGLREDEKLPRRMYRPDTRQAETTAVELEFLSLDDFSPINIVKQVKLLRDLLDARNRLSDLLTKLDGNTELEAQLRDIIGNTDKLQQLQAVAAVQKAEDAVNAVDVSDDDPAVKAEKDAAAEAKAAAEAAQKAVADARNVAGVSKTAAEANLTVAVQKAATAQAEAEAKQAAFEKAKAVAAAKKAEEKAEADAAEAQKAIDAQKPADPKKGAK